MGGWEAHGLVAGSSLLPLSSSMGRRGSSDIVLAFEDFAQQAMDTGTSCSPREWNTDALMGSGTLIQYTPATSTLSEPAPVLTSNSEIS